MTGLLYIVFRSLPTPPFSKFMDPPLTVGTLHVRKAFTANVYLLIVNLAKYSW